MAELTVENLETVLRLIADAGPDPWYLLEPDVDHKRRQRPDAFASPAELTAFLAHLCGGLRPSV